MYCHTLFDGRKYFGKTSQPLSRRWRTNGEGYVGSPFYDAIKEYGWGAFAHDVISSGLTENEAKALEEKLIKENKTQYKEYGFNVTGGDGWRNPTEEQVKVFAERSRIFNTGRKHTEEYKSKMSERMRGDKNPNANGRLLTPERIRKFAEYAKKPKAEIQKKRMSESAKKRKIKCVDTGVVYESMKDASEKLGIKYTAITSAVYRGRKTHGHEFITIDDDYCNLRI